MKWLLSLMLFSTPLIGKSLIIDTDGSLGDMIAILYLVNDPNVEVKAITTNGVGISHAKHSALNILSLLMLTNRPDIPVSVGTKTSLSPHTNFPKKMREQADKLYGFTLPKNPNFPNKLYSVDLIENILLESKEPVSILCLGPVTNLANALEKSSPLQKNIDKVYLLGTQKVSDTGGGEHNILLDAKAASMVIGSGLPITIIPLEQNPSTELQQGVFSSMKEETLSPSGQFVLQVLNESKSESLLWASVAAVYTVYPEISSVTEKRISILLTHESINYGETQEHESGNPIKILNSLNSEKFKDLFLKQFKQ